MKNLTELIKAEMKRQYGSIKEFSVQTKIPMSTVNTAFPKGIETSSYNLVKRICTILGIKHICDDEITYVNREFDDLVHQIQSLDEQGLTTIKALLDVEKARCEGKADTAGHAGNPSMNGHNGVSHIEKPDERIKERIREVPEDENGRSHAERSGN